MQKGKGKVFTPPFVRLPKGLIFKCEEWKKLTQKAKVLYIMIKAKFNGSNNGRIRLHYSELRSVRGFSSHGSISHAFKELESGGWIKRTKIGGLYRHVNEYELTGKYDDML